MECIIHNYYTQSMVIFVKTLQIGIHQTLIICHKWDTRIDNIYI